MSINYSHQYKIFITREKKLKKKENMEQSHSKNGSSKEEISDSNIFI